MENLRIQLKTLQRQREAEYHSGGSVVVLNDLQAVALHNLLGHKLLDSTEAVTLESLGTEIKVVFSHSDTSEVYLINSEGGVIDDNPRV
jgi:hypothetical protein